MIQLLVDLLVLGSVETEKRDFGCTVIITDALALGRGHGNYSGDPSFVLQKLSFSQCFLSLSPD